MPIRFEVRIILRVINFAMKNTVLLIKVLINCAFNNLHTMSKLKLECYLEWFIVRNDNCARQYNYSK